MDLPTESLQYFKNYDSMKGKIGVGTIYIYAPEGEIMPQVVLSPIAGISTTPPKASKAAAEPAAPVAAPKAPGTSMAADRIQRPGKAAATPAIQFPSPGRAKRA
jgi:hypothetical protein